MAQINALRAGTAGAEFQGRRTVTACDREKEGASLAARVETTVGSLNQLEQLISSGDLDSRVLNEFRNAMNHIRNTASAIQQWVRAQGGSGDRYAILSILAAQRVHHATQLARDLSLDLHTMEISIETKGLRELYEAVDELHRSLAVLYRRGA
jgi:hypothetical protein